MNPLRHSSPIASLPASTSRPELESFACAIGKDEELWKEFERHDAEERQYQQLYRDPNIDVWLICWVDRQ